MMSDFLQDRLINKLNGYYLILYANDHLKMAKTTECLNNCLVFFLVSVHLIPSRIRLAQK